MSSPCSSKILELRVRNRALLDQLESNSILLERRLKKLKHTARTAKSSDRTWQDLPPSPLKRKYESWKARNYSGQVSAALNTAVYKLSSSSSDIQDFNTEYKQRMEDSMTSPAKRSKRNALIVSRPRSKDVQHCKSCRSPFKSSTEIDVTGYGKGCDCYCKKLADKAGTHSDITSPDEEGAIPPLHIGNDMKDKESSVLQSAKYNTKDGILDTERHRRTLETAHAIINYSPESIFLRRLKERSQAVGDLIAPGNIRRNLAKTSSGAPPMKCIHSDKGTARTIPTKTLKQSPVKANQGKYSPPKSPHSPGTTFAHGGSELFSDGSKQHINQQPPSHSPRRPHKDEPRRLKNRKRVCHRKDCHCRVQKNVQSRKRFSSDAKENVKAEPVGKQELSSPGNLSPSPCECHCDCSTRQMLPPKIPLIASDTVAALVDNEHDKKHIQPRCCCAEGSSWFNELNKFRQSHWFDCHAHAHPSSTSLDSARKWGRDINHPTGGHKCVHKYVLDDRLFARPLYSDHQNNSRCILCHLPCCTSKSEVRETPPITLPSTLQDPEIQVSIPLGSPRASRPSASGNVLFHKKMTQPSGKGRATSSPRSKPQSSLLMRTLGDLKSRQPPPANSLALRYQKGVAK